MYFKLDKEFLLIEGRSKAKIIDICTGEDYPIDLNCYEIINNLNNNMKIEDAEKMYGKQEVSNIIDFLYNKFGILYDNKVFNDTLKMFNMTRESFSRLNKFLLNRASIELSNECNFNCIFCDHKKYDFRICGCKRWENGLELPYKKWAEIVNQLYKLGVKEIMIYGGNPILKWNKLSKLLDLINLYEIKARIFTNGTLITKQIAKKLRKLNVNLHLQILDQNEETYNYLTQTKGSFKEVKDTLKIIDDQNISCIFTILVNKCNEDNIKAIKEYYGNRQYKIQYIYPPNKFSISDKSMLYDEKNRQIKTYVTNYQHIQEKNLCFNRSIFISAEGLVYPCTMLRDFKLGDLKEEDLYEIFMREDYKQFWNLSKSKISGCSSCRNRLSCFDCRAIEYYSTKDLYSMKYCQLINE